MAFLSTKSGSILSSFIIASALVGGAYYLSSASTNRANAASTDDILKAYASKDTDGDGLPDWEEALYGTDPTKSDTFGLGMTDAQAVAAGKIKLKIGANAPAAPASSDSSLANGIPGPVAASTTLTDQFAQAFLNNYLSTRGSQPPTADEAATFVQGAVANLVQTQVRPDAYTASDVRVSGSGQAALRSYAAAAESAYESNAAGEQYDELTYFQDAVQKNDAAAIDAMQQLSKGYIQAAAALIAIPVPQEAAAQHLAFVNALARVGETIGDMATLQTDPIRSLVALGDYAQDAQNLGQTLANLNSIFVSEGLSIGMDEAGGKFYGLTVSAAAIVASSTKP